MKCDVCLTNIPLGEDRCPNCGFLMKTDHITTFDAFGDDHAHIKVTTKDKIKKIKQYVPHNKPAFTRLNRNQRNLYKPNTTSVAIKVALIFIIIAGIIISSLFGLFSSISDYEVDVQFEDMTFEEIINEDLDDGTVFVASSYRDNFVEYLDNNSYKDIVISEYCSQYEDSPLYANMCIDALKDDIHYYVDISFSEGNIQNVSLTLSGRLDKGVDRNKFYITKNQVNEIADYIEIQKAYQSLKDSHDKMQLNENNEYKYSHYDDIKIYMVEEYQDNYDAYYFYYSIGTR